MWINLLACKVHIDRTDWCGWFAVIHAPRWLSLKTGHGLQGLQWRVWMQRGHDIVRISKATMPKRADILKGRV